MVHGNDFVRYAIQLITTPDMLTGDSFMQAYEKFNECKPSWKENLLMRGLLMQIENVPEIQCLRALADMALHSCPTATPAATYTSPDGLQLNKRQHKGQTSCNNSDDIPSILVPAEVE